MPRTQEQFNEMREATTAKIKEVALELFANDGYHSTSISKIAQKAGISKGLMYNYFESKEDLLCSIFEDISNKTIDMLDPNHDNEITDKEADEFFDKYFDSLLKSPQEWRLYFQISVQQDALNAFMNKGITSKIEANQLLIYNFFQKQYPEDPQTKMMMFSAILKGFTLMYAFSPEMFPKELLESSKAEMKKMFLKSTK